MGESIYTTRDYERDIGFLNKRISVLELTIQVMILKSGLETIANSDSNQAELAKSTLEKARQYGLLD